MTNADKYPTFEEQRDAYLAFCRGHEQCTECPLWKKRCHLDEWKKLEAGDTP